METQTVFAVVKLELKAETVHSACSKVDKANALNFAHSLPELASAKVVLAKPSPIDINNAGVQRILEMTSVVERMFK